VIQDFQLAIGVVRPFSPGGSVMDKFVKWRWLRRLFAIDVRLKGMFLPLIAARGLLERSTTGAVVHMSTHSSTSASPTMTRTRQQATRTTTVGAALLGTTRW
jgi:hypothetical protein